MKTYIIWNEFDNLAKLNGKTINVDDLIKPLTGKFISLGWLP